MDLFGGNGDELGPPDTAETYSWRRAPGSSPLAPPDKVWGTPPQGWGLPVGADATPPVVSVDKVGDAVRQGWGGPAGASATPDTKPVQEASRPARPDGRFRKGQSGNPKGRPPKRERSYTERQFARDFLAEFNRVVNVNGERMPAGVIAIRQLINAGAKGDSAAAKVVLQLYEKSLKVVGATSKKAVESLDFFEEHNASGGHERRDRNVAKFMNRIRRESRDL